jgi:tetratricopeptide (TPR) repeat protein
MGDLIIKGDETKIPLSFAVILYAIDGNVVGRQSVGNNGRYRFHEVPNGEYEIAVESDNQEVARIYLLIQELRLTDIRKDIRLQWRDSPVGGGAGRSVPAEIYARSSEANQRWKQAEEAAQRGEHDGALQILQQILRDDPEDYEAWAELGTVHFRKGRHGDAEKAYKRALKERPTYSLALLNLGKLYVARKKYQDAVDTLSKAVAVHSQSADGHYFLGEAYLQVKKGTKAVEHFTEALRLDPKGKADAHLRLAALYNAAGMKDRAAAEYRQFLDKNPNHPEKGKLEKYIRENRKPDLKKDR